MVMCNFCHSLFGDGEVVYLRHVEEPKEAVCPYCGSDDIDDVERCSECGELHIVEHLEDGSLCIKCADKAKNTFISLIKNHFTKSEIEFLNSQYDLFESVM